MFNKPNLFPKANEPQPARGARLVPGSAVGASPAESATHARESAASGASTVAGAGQAGEPEKSGESGLIVGPHVKLRGAEILDCDTLVVEGRVEATMDSRVIRISEHGSFSGTVGIDVAEVHGQFDGELTARSQLIIHATGRVSGKIRYGKILIEEGGEISGDIKSLDSAASARKPDSATSVSATGSVSPVRAAEATG
jgi:cytoskeletal protein CcmA (bactofilin family)